MVVGAPEPGLAVRLRPEESSAGLGNTQVPKPKGQKQDNSPHKQVYANTYVGRERLGRVGSAPTENLTFAKKALKS